MAKAKASFLKNCLPCHGPDGRGTVGPNLTDNHQVHGSSRVDIYNTIYQGVPAKGMITWGKILPPEEIRGLAAFVGTLRGTNVPGGKPPEGEPVEALP